MIESGGGRGLASPRGVVVATAAVLAGIVYSSFWLELALPTGLDPIKAYASELFARDQPYRPLFAGAEIISGLLAIVAGVAALGNPNDSMITGRVWWGWAGMIFFGAMTIADSLLPMDCSITKDAACAQAEPAGRLSVVHDLHTASSTLAVAGGLIGMIALAESKPARILAAAQVVVTAALLIVILTDGPIGLVQRVQVTLFSAWLVITGARYGGGVRRA